MANPENGKYLGRVTVHDVKVKENETGEPEITLTASATTPEAKAGFEKILGVEGQDPPTGSRGRTYVSNFDSGKPTIWEERKRAREAEKKKTLLQ